MVLRLGLLVLTEVYCFTLEGLYLGSNLVRSCMAVQEDKNKRNVYILCCLHRAIKISKQDFELLEHSQPWLFVQNVTSLL